MYTDHPSSFDNRSSRRPLGPLIEPLPPIAEPAPPEDLAFDGPRGAIAAATYYLELVDYAFDSGDTSRLRELVSAGDGINDEWIDRLEETHAAGRRMRSRPAVRLTEPEIDPEGKNEGFTNVAFVDAPGLTQVIDRAGRVVEEWPGWDRRENWFAVSRGPRGWVVDVYESMEECLPRPDDGLYHR